MEEKSQFTLARLLVGITAFSVTFGLMTIGMQREYVWLCAVEALAVGGIALKINRNSAKRALLIPAVMAGGFVFLIMLLGVIEYLDRWARS